MATMIAIIATTKTMGKMNIVSPNPNTPRTPTKRYPTTENTEPKILPHSLMANPQILNNNNDC